MNFELRKKLFGMKIFILLCLFSFQCFAAGPVTHLYLAEKWMEETGPLTEKEQTLFRIGNLFPDIRYLGGVTREETHKRDVMFEDVCSAPSPFISGMYLHALFDIIRETFVIESRIYVRLQDSADGQEATLLKLIEDQFFYSAISPSLIVEELSKISDQELKTGISHDKIYLWHSILKHYFKLGPVKLLSKLAANGQPFFQVPAKTIKIWNEQFPYLMQDPEIIVYLELLRDKVHSLKKSVYE